MPEAGHPQPTASSLQSYKQAATNCRIYRTRHVGGERRSVLRGYLELLRPANVVTAIADVLAGYAVAGRSHPQALPWLVGATMCLYAGGVVLNDVFDRHIDAVERPERPIPSGRVSVPRAATLGASLLTAGVLAASQATRDALIVGAAIAA